jgi:hypothetical protein
MVDASRRPPSAPAAPFEVVGINGLGGLPEPRNPAIPDIAIPDRTQDFQQRTEQSIANAYNTASSVVDAAARYNMSKAEQRSRSGFTGVVEGTIAAVQSGYTLYKELKAERMAQEAAEYETSQKNLAAAFENQIQGQLTDLYRAAAEHTSDRGLIPAFTESVNKIRAQYLGRLDAEVLQAITNTAWEGIQAVQVEQGQRWITEAENLQSETRNFRLFEVEAEIMSLITSISHGPGRANPENLIATINTKLRDYVVANNLSPMDTLSLFNGVYPKINAALQEAGIASNQFAHQQQVLTSVMGRAYEIDAEAGGNESLRNAKLAPLQLELNAAGIDIQLTDVFLSQWELTSRNLEYVERMSALQRAREEATAQGLPSSGEYGRAESVQIAAQAMEWVNNPVGSAQQIEYASQDDAPLPLKAAYRVYQDFQEDRAELTRLQQEFADSNVAIAEAQVKLEQLRDRYDPDGRLGIPVTIIPGTIERLQTIGASSPPNISREVLALASQLEGLNIEQARARQQTLEGQIRDLSSRWINMGINLMNPTDTAGLQRALAEVAPILERARAAPQSNNLNPSDFSVGLPPLPQQ